MKRIFIGFISVTALVTTLQVQAASPESYAGKQPHVLLKSAPDFAKAFRDATSDLELPAWTKRLAAGQSAEIVDIGGSKLVLTSACGKQGCLDQRLYILFDPKAKTATGIFFLPPASDDPGDSRIAFSQWLGTPSKEAADFLLQRAISDAFKMNEPKP